ncbi:hypothetical protein KSP40_PGU000211 [Platanthera guangdongensis]|uniref:Senescence regulator n=1 Tax=Platanthera guangdongensis TaxID=2320717 RepID=A0ABR2LQR1_9ASPA
MAAPRNHQVLKHTIRFFSTSRSGKEGIASSSCGSAGGISADELDESDFIWASTSPPRAGGFQPTWKNIGDGSACPSAVASLPVNIPAWSKMLRGGRSCQALDEEEDEDEGGFLPPHEVVRRRRAESFSMVEGIGRTLKGRDISRVRNAVWAQTGFQD